MFTPQAARKLDERLDYDPEKLARLMRAQGLRFEPGKEYNIPGGTLVTDSRGIVTDVWTSSYTRVLKVKQ